MRTREARREIEGLLAKWRPIMGLDSWVLTVVFDEKDVLAYCADADVRYKTATLGFNLARYRRKMTTMYKKHDLIVHELVHCITPKSTELMVTLVTYAILRAHGLEP